MVYIMVLWDDANGIGDYRATLDEAQARAWLTEHRHESAVLAGAALEGVDELWAAIEKLEWIAYDAGQADGLGDDLAQRRDALLAQREYVRDLLGLTATD